MPLILKLHIFSTLFMTGLIWCIQVVHYPLFFRVGESTFCLYEQSHQKRISMIVLPVMIVELGTGVLLMLQAQTYDWYITMALLGGIWVSTFLFQVPCHRILSQGFDPLICKRLVRSNWIRTVLWTVRAIIFIRIM